MISSRERLATAKILVSNGLLGHFLKVLPLNTRWGKRGSVGAKIRRSELYARLKSKGVMPMDRSYKPNRFIFEYPIMVQVNGKLRHLLGVIDWDLAGAIG